MTYDGSSWSAPVDIDGTTPLTSVSCSSSSFCMVVDKAGNAFTYDGSSWGAPASIDPGREFSSVSCPSSSFCMAVNRHGNALTYDGSSWSLPSSVDPDHQLSSVSCPVEFFCVAVDYSGNAFTYQGSPPRSSAGETVASLPPDTIPPDTKIFKKVLKRRPLIFLFHFQSSEPGSTFRCKLDRRPFAACPSSERFGHLKPGRHVLEVAAVDAASNKDPTPVVARFIVPKAGSTGTDIVA